MQRLFPPASKRGQRQGAVILLTIALLLAVLSILPSLTDRLTTGGWIPPNSEAVQVDEQLASVFNRRATSHLIHFSPVDADKGLQHPEVRRELARVTRTLSSLPGVSAVYTPLDAPTAAMRSSLTAPDASAWLAVVQVEEDLPATIAHLPAIQEAVESDRFTANVTGIPALSAEFGAQVKTDLLRAELIALPIALLCLTWFAGGIRPAVAILLATITSLATTFLMIWIASHVVTISIFALSTVAMLTIALSLDFGLLHMLRRADRDGARHTRATVIVASLAVIAGMAGLAILPVEAARSIGIVGVVGIGIVALSQRFLLPVWMEILSSNQASGTMTTTSGTSRWLGLVSRHPAASLLIGVVILLPLLAPVTGMRLAGPDAGALPDNTPAVRTLDTITEQFPAIAASPISVIVDPADGSMLDASNLFSLKQTADRISSLEGVQSVTTVWDLVPGGISSPMLTASLALDPTLVEQARPLLTEEGAVIEISASSDDTTRVNLVELLRTQAAHLSNGELRFMVGGADAASIDLVDSIVEIMLPAAALVALATVLVLMVAFRSVVLPLKAVLLNAIPVLAGLGVVTWLFQTGTPWTDGSDATVIIVPMILAWLMYGVSMDYEVFMLARIREYRQKGHGNRDATVRGIAGARAVVSRGAILMGIVFLAFSTGDVLAVRAIGVGLLVAIVVDATIVRLVLLPASMILLGRWNWWWPQWLPARSLDRGGYSADHAPLGDR